MKLGYARVSTDDQRLDLQINSLNEVGSVALEMANIQRDLLRDRVGEMQSDIPQVACYVR